MELPFYTLVLALKVLIVLPKARYFHYGDQVPDGITNQSCGNSINFDNKSEAYLISPEELFAPILCRWDITIPLGKQLKFIFQYFFLYAEDVTCSDIFLQIEDITGVKKYCDYLPSEYILVSPGPITDVIFYSMDIRAPDEGFHIKLKLVDSPCHLQFTDVVHGTFFSPHYPHYYPNDEVCSWKIQVPDGYIIELNCRYKFWIENSPFCRRDVLFVSPEGSDNFHDAFRFCGRRGPGILHSEGTKLTALFKSDSFYHYSGFRCDFEALEGMSNNSTPLPPTNPNICGVCGIAGNSSQARVVNGFVPQVNQFPWTVAVLSRKSNGNLNQYCGGSLINDRYVLSAAHCFTNRTPDSVAIDLGDHDLTETDESPAILVNVEKFILHPLYGNGNIPNNNDIALVKLSRAVNFTNQMRPICLPPVNQNFDNQRAIVAGWGKTSTSAESSPVLLAAELMIIPLQTCQEIYRGKITITNNMICAGGIPNQRPTDACGGDSGGPLILNEEGRWILIGVVSTGPPSGACGDPNFPGIYSRVNNYLQWIVDNSQEDSNCSVVQIPNFSKTAEHSSYKWSPTYGVAVKIGRRELLSRINLKKMTSNKTIELN